jgi:hypothetical protein
MFFLGSPLFVLAVDCSQYTTEDACPSTCNWNGSTCVNVSEVTVDLNNCENDAVCSAIVKIQGYIELVGGVVIGMMIVIGGFMYATGGGNEKQLSTAKSMITCAVIGMIILLSADIITTTVKTLMGWSS